MHELSIAMSIVELAGEEAERRGASSITAVHVKLGPLAGVIAEALQSAFELAIEQTAMAGSRLIIDTVPVTAFCPSCNGPRSVVSPQLLLCRDCTSPTNNVITGQELELTALEIDE